jgi:glycosyltransferase involved in cell wall biosynthesis
MAEPAPRGRVAIVIVCRNALAALARTLDSIRLRGDADRVATVVIDGASSDGTPALLNARAAELHHFSSERDDGIYDAMNKGWLAAPADAHVLYLGAGDTLLSFPPAQQLLRADGTPHPLLLGRTTVGDREFRSRWGAEMKLRNTAHHQALLVHRGVSNGPPFDASLSTYADWDFNLHLLARGLAPQRAPALHTHAEPGGRSWAMSDTVEMYRVARRHGGLAVGVLSWALNSVSRLQRRLGAR